MLDAPKPRPRAPVGEPAAAAAWQRAAGAWARPAGRIREAYARWRRAEALLAAEERDEAAAALIGAHAIATRLGAAWLSRRGRVAGRTSAPRARRRRVALPTADDGDRAGENPFGLTERERQVLVLVASGATNREIAAELFMAEKTASVHVSRILGKLGVRGRTEAAAVAHRQGLADPLAAGEQ